ncbi:hypothetical protein CW702_02310 [Candidatus Bathyarchaeota archaeon]|nr:MAG: hypothetical protein CW702_02310 [Candidatus Bathyarchaeota archaeon]
MELDEETVNRIIKAISLKKGLSRWEARTALHKYICEGKCEWYKTRSADAGFDRHSLKEDTRVVIEEAIKEYMPNVNLKDAKRRIHRILCPS